MAELLLFHHAYGLTTGVRGFAETLRQAGHTVHTPDLYDGRVFDTLDEGLAHASATGFGTLIENGVRAGLPERESWRAAFGLTVSLVWIYTNLLRILAVMRR